MGREAICRCKWGGVTAQVKALLETQELILRGELRKRVPFAELKSIEAKGERLCFTVAGERVELALGNDYATKWAAAILAGPKPLAKKLGITSETAVRVIGEPGDETLNEALAQAAQILARNATLIVACVETPAELASALKKSGEQLAAGVPIWLVYPKGKGHPLNESMIRDAVLSMGLVDTKVAAVSDRLTAIRFNLRRKS